MLRRDEQLDRDPSPGDQLESGGGNRVPGCGVRHEAQGAQDDRGHAMEMAPAAGLLGPRS